MTAHTLITVEVISAVVAAVLTSSVVAALVAGYFGDRNERRKQLRDQRIALAGEFAGDAMAALATMRDLKPTRGIAHRNEKLSSRRRSEGGAHSGGEAGDRPAKAAEGEESGSSSPAEALLMHPPLQPQTGLNTSSVASARTEVVCHQFWAECDALAMVEGTQSDDLSSREELEKKYNTEYDRVAGGHVEGSDPIHGLCRKANRR